MALVVSAPGGRMGGGYHISVDPFDMASRYSAIEDPWDDGEPPPKEEEMVSVEEAISWIPQESVWDVLAPILPRLPEREADLLELYFKQGKRQADIAIVFEVSQAAISYRIVRALHRVRFLREVPDITEEDLRRDLPFVPMKQIDIDILVGMWETTCQSAVALKLDLTQGRVRHRFFSAVKVLERASQQDDRFAPYHKFFASVAKKNWNALRSVKLPQWSGRGQDICS